MLNTNRHRSSTTDEVRGPHGDFPANATATSYAAFFNADRLPGTLGRVRGFSLVAEAFTPDS
jgi:hypothetical protein